MAVKRIIIVLFSAAMLMLSACSSDEEDIRNLRGDTGSTTSLSAGAETQGMYDGKC